MRSCLILAAAILTAMPARGATPGIAGGTPRPQPGLTAALSAWREIPVLEDGRIMPLDTFARRMADTICHAQTPKLATGVDGKLVRWQADELLLDWLVRPAAWEDVPFLTAEHEEVRKLLDLPLFIEGATGRERLKHAAPSDVEDCAPLRERLMTIDERRAELLATQRLWRDAPGLSGLFLNDVKRLSTAAAGILATHRAGGLSLNGLALLSEDLAERLLPHPLLCLDGVKSVTDRVASLLASYQGGVLSLKGLERVSGSALARLRDNPRIELPTRLREAGEKVAGAAACARDPLVAAIDRLAAAGEHALRP